MKTLLCILVSGWLLQGCNRPPKIQDLDELRAVVKLADSLQVHFADSGKLVFGDRKYYFPETNSFEDGSYMDHKRVLIENADSAWFAKSLGENQEMNRGKLMKMINRFNRMLKQKEIYILRENNYGYCFYNFHDKWLNTHHGYLYAPEKSPHYYSTGCITNDVSRNVQILPLTSEWYRTSSYNYVLDPFYTLWTLDFYEPNFN